MLGLFVQSANAFISHSVLTNCYFTVPVLLLITRSVPLALPALHQFPVFLESKLADYTWPWLSDNSSHPGSSS